MNHSHTPGHNQVTSEICIASHARHDIAIMFTRIHILQAKLDTDTISDLYSLIESNTAKGPLHFELSADPSDADVIVTTVRMRKRFERHLDWKIAVMTSRLPYIQSAEYNALSDRRRLSLPNGFATPFNNKSSCHVVNMQR
jgi:hypothetical protein